MGMAMSLMVLEAIGKQINPTRGRQIVETESSEWLTPEEQVLINKDWKHILHRWLVASKGKELMKKILGDEADTHSELIASQVSHSNQAGDEVNPMRMMMVE